MTAVDESTFRWTGTTAPWRIEQQRVRKIVRVTPLRSLPRYVVGVDCALSHGPRSRRVAGELVYIRAAAVVFDRIAKSIVEEQIVEQPCDAPYVPGFLTFREAPAILTAIKRLKHPFGAILFDGQGVAHPRRCGLATHIGVLLDLPSVGVAKSRLIGTFADVPPAVGAFVPLMDQQEQIGVVYRTRQNVRPLFISVGHRVNLESSINLVRECQTKFRLPEPTRIADRLSKFR